MANEGEKSTNTRKNRGNKDGGSIIEKIKKITVGGDRLTTAMIGSPNRTRTCDPMINSHLLYQLSYRGIVAMLCCWLLEQDSNL